MRKKHANKKVNQSQSATEGEIKKNHKTWSNLLVEYTSSSTLHGLRYVSERKLSVYEKMFWLITFILSVALCFIVIANLYMKWKSNPLIVTIDENIISASKIPFPSITICPQTKCRNSVFNYTAARKLEEYAFLRNSNCSISKSQSREKRNLLPNQRQHNKFYNIATVCEGIDVITHKLKLHTRQPAHPSLVQDIQEVAEPLENIFFRCNWRRNKTHCKNFFKRVLTREGVCFNMNSLAVRDLLKLENIHSQYSYIDENFRETGKLLYGRINGPGPDLDIVLKRNFTDRDISCNTLNEGYKIYMQSPDDMPSTSLYHYSVLDNEVASLAVKCNIFETVADLKANTAEERQCYFEGEKNLTYFNTYTAHNCWLECLSKYTFEKCGCVGFYLPRNESVPLCSFGSYYCTMAAEDELADMEAYGNVSTACSCLPACYSIAYAADVTKSQFNYKIFLNIEFDGKYDKSLQYSRIMFFFQQSGYVAMRRTKIFGWIDFIASCGGLLGLFLGFSVLSIVEIMYYVTIRYWCSNKQDFNEDNKKTNISSIT